MSTPITIKDTSANPAPLGLTGFGLTTILLNLHNAGFYPNNSMVLGMGIFVGGIAQVIAGVLESKKNNTFGTTAFTAYGAFWLSLVATWALPKLGIADKADDTAMSCYLAIWGLFTFGMFIGTFRLNRALQLVEKALASGFDPADQLKGSDYFSNHRVKALVLIHAGRPQEAKQWLADSLSAYDKFKKAQKRPLMVDPENALEAERMRTLDAGLKL